MTLKETYAYDDVTLIPAYSELKSRSEANPSMHGYKLPIIASCMDVFGKDMMECITTNNIPFIAHRAFKSAEDQFKAFIPDMCEPDKINYENIWFAVGSVQKYEDWINTLITLGVRKFCVDMAHGDSLSCIDTIKFLRKRLADQPETIFGKPHIIAGNVATPEGFKRLQKAGADGIRVGIASGQICFTPNTKVWYISPSGKMYQKEIQHIEVGDKVITASGRARKVVNKFINDYSGEIYKIEGENIGATPTHKFYTFNTITHTKEFIEIANIDDRFMTFINAEGKTLEKQIDIDEYTGKVYNIEVEDEHTYAVGSSMLGVSNCTTNLQTGFGVPILTNIIDCAKIKKNTWLIADGGCRYSGDIAKAIYFGADFVMMGKMLAATDLATGACYNSSYEELEPNIRLDHDEPSFSLIYPDEFERVYKLAEEIDWHKHDQNCTRKNMCKRNVVTYKEYHGMASRAARTGILNYASVEGCQGLIKYTGRTKDFIQDTYLHLQASLSYGGAKTWNEFRKKVKAAKRSEAGIIAADVHMDKVTNI